MARHPQRPCSAANGRLRVGHISGKGRAVFAASAICKDELIAVWGGVILPMEERAGVQVGSADPLQR